MQSLPNLVAGQFRQTPIFETISIFGDVGSNPALEALLDAGADVNFRSSIGNTPALVAASLGRFDLVYELINRGADCSLSNDQGHDLIYFVRSKRSALNPNHELFSWLERVSAWLRDRGAGV